MKYISLSSGSCGNCHYITGRDTKIVIDAGISGKRAIEHLAMHGQSMDGLDAILVTHEHIDHIQAVGILSRKFNTPVYATEKTWEHMKKHVGKIKEENIRVFRRGETLGIKNIEVGTFEISHDAVEPVGYTLTQGNQKISVVTDIGHVSDEVFRNIKGSDIAVIESNYDPHMLNYCSYPYPLKQRIRSETGHLSNEEAGYLGAALIKSGTRKLLLAHLSKESNLPQLAFQTVASILSQQDIGPEDAGLDVMLRGRVSKIYSIE